MPDAKKGVPPSTFSEYKIILDLPSKAPSQQFRDYARAFKEVIEVSDPQFALGIFGGWGSGKTTLMNAIEDQLDKDQIITAQFNAWRYEKEQDLIVPLLDVIREALIQWYNDKPDARETAQKVASTIGDVAASLVAGIGIKIGLPLIGEISISGDKAITQAAKRGRKAAEDTEPRSLYHACFRKLCEAFAQFAEDYPERRFVVFIDDLDRCLPESALTVLESMKLFFDLKGFVFVVALDRNVIEWCIDAKYKQETPSTVNQETSATPEARRSPAYQIRGRDYVKKLFQVPFALPSIATENLDNFLHSVYEEAQLPPAQEADIRDRVVPHLRYIIDAAGVNPREIKRYINAYTLLIKMKPHLDQDAILALQTIAFRPDWQTVRESLYAYREVFLDAVRRQTEEEGTLLKNLELAVGTVPQSFLTYVAADCPGNSLLQVTQIDEYLYSGEAFSSTEGPGLLEAIRDVGALREHLQRIVDASDIEALEERSKAFTSFEVSIDYVTSHLRKYATPITGSIRRELGDLLKETRSSLSRYDQMPEAERAQFNWQDWLAEREQELGHILKSLMEAHRDSSLVP